MTAPFRRSAQAVAEVNGLPAYPFAVIEHPIANDDDAALRAKAEIALEQILPFLMQRNA
jgi:hypothetical protein